MAERLCGQTPGCEGRMPCMPTVVVSHMAQNASWCWVQGCIRSNDGQPADEHAEKHVMEVVLCYFRVDVANGRWPRRPGVATCLVNRLAEVQGVGSSTGLLYNGRRTQWCSAGLVCLETVRRPLACIVVVSCRRGG